MRKPRYNKRPAWKIIVDGYPIIVTKPVLIGLELEFRERFGVYLHSTEVTIWDEVPNPEMQQMWEYSPDN